MLTADLVNARRRGEKLFVSPLGESARARALALAGAYLQLAASHVGQPREALLDACRQVPAAPQDRKLARGLLKLVLDRCDFAEETALDPVDLRRRLFGAASVRRAVAPSGAVFDQEAREALVAETAASLGVAPADVERGLYADLPAAHVLAVFARISPQALIDGYDLAQWQAVLLRAVRVTAQVRPSSPDRSRRLFRRLKFLGLVPRVTALAEDQPSRNASPSRRRPATPAYELVLDGPFSLFESVTRYGLALGLALPAIAGAGRWSLVADLLWGTGRMPLRFELEGAGHDVTEESAAPEAGLRDDVRQLWERLQGPPVVAAGWRAAVSRQLIPVPGGGLCIPDLELTHAASGRRVLVEVLGFWSRESVFARLDLVRAGLATPIVFAVSRHLRVSEALLDDSAHAALYVYARVIGVEGLLARASAVLGLGRRAPARG